ncbi:MAG: nitrile hydratase subunit beta [Rhizomicrobium sp.]|jgi:nitrile hydratase
MNGVHDMGGMHGFGAIEPERDEPVFHEAWEGRLFAIRGQLGRFGNIDHRRSLIEQIPPARYLADSYYERWLDSTLPYCEQKALISTNERAAIDKGLADADANHARVEPAPPSPYKDYTRPISSAPHYAIGQTVCARNINPAGHTRLPRYARGKHGLVIADHGGFVFPDTNALNQGECPARLYTVRFTARELWGADAHAKDTVSLDLWEPYLERA